MPATATLGHLGNGYHSSTVFDTPAPLIRQKAAKIIQPDGSSVAYSTDPRAAAALAAAAAAASRSAFDSPGGRTASVASSVGSSQASPKRKTSGGSAFEIPNDDDKPWRSDVTSKPPYSYAVMIIQVSALMQRIL